MCEVTYQEKLKSVSSMLSEDSINFFSNLTKTCHDLMATMQLVRELYNSEDKSARIFTKWQTMNLSQ